MIKPNVRASFGRAEAELILSVVGPGGEERLREQGLDALLDDVALLPALLRRDRVSRAPARLLFYLLVRHALLQREIHDRQLADYTAAVLLEVGLAARARPTPRGRVWGRAGGPARPAWRAAGASPSATWSTSWPPSSGRAATASSCCACTWATTRSAWPGCSPTTSPHACGPGPP